MFAAPEFMKVIDSSAEVFREAVSSSIGYKISDDLKAHLEKDIYIFSGFKTYAQLKEIALMLRDDQGNLISYSEFEKKVLDINENYNVNYLRTEYNLAISSALMAARWEAFARDADQYDLQYRTAGDEHVRESHRKMDRITLSFEDLFWLYFFPPNGWGCRCTVVQVRKGKYPLSDSAEAIRIGNEATEDGAEIFRFNPGRARILFPPKHPYNNSVCATCNGQNPNAGDEMCAWCAAVQSYIQ